MVEQPSRPSIDRTGTAASWAFITGISSIDSDRWPCQTVGGVGSTAPSAWLSSSALTLLMMESVDRP